MISDPLYREIILEHWEHPQNLGVLSKPDIDITRVNPFCGDTIRITAILRKGVVSDISFTSDGCAISTASVSLLTSLVKGMPVAKFLRITPEKFLSTFQIQFSPARMKCALLGFFALKSALTSRPAKKS